MKHFVAVVFSLALGSLGVEAHAADQLDRDALKQQANVFLQGGRYLNSYRFAEAEQCFDKAIELNPSDAAAYYYAGLNQQGYALASATPDQKRAHLEKAESYYQHAIKLLPTSVDGHLHLASVENDLGEYTASFEQLQSALALPDITDRDRASVLRGIEMLKAKMSGSAKNPNAEAPAKPTTNVTEPQMPTASLPSSSIAGSGSGATVPPTPFAGFVPIMDSTEKSFTIEVPRGWKALATLARHGPIDVRPVVRVESPDGLIHVGFGHDQISPGTVPTASLMQLGFYPGRAYGTSTIAPYTPGAAFAKAFIRLKWKPIVGKYEILETEALPQLAPIWNGTGNTRSDCGAVRVALNWHGADRGYAIASTFLKASAGSAMWWVSLWGSAIYPSDREAGALYVLTHMMQTFRWDPAWQQNSDRVTAMVSADYAAHAAVMNQAIMQRYQTIQDTNNIITGGYWGRQQVYNNLSTARSDAMLGQERVIDPNNGAKYKVDAAAEHWTDGNTIINGGGGQPGPDFHRMENVPF